MRKQPIYLDNHATTPLDPRVLEAMMPYLTTQFGNASSRSHAYGWTADAAVEKARAQVAELIGASPKEIIFTSGATESDNLAIKGVAEAYRTKGDRILTLPTEHKAVLDACKRLERTRAEHLSELRRLRASDLGEGADLEHDEVLRRWSDSSRAGARVTYLPVRPDGLVELEALERAIGSSTILVSIMLANNEIGVVQPVNDIGRLCREKGVLFHSDAVQGAGKVPFDVNAASVDLASLSSHKIYGPKGVGALYVRRKPRVSLASMIDGGGQERGMRAGTLPVAAIVGFGKAAELCRTALAAESERLFRLRERLRESLYSRLDGVRLNGSLEHRLPGNLNVSFAHVDAEALMMAMRDVALSSGSACASASLEGSHVLKACGVEDEQAHGSIRFGIGRFNTEEEIDFVADSVVENVRRLRAMSPMYEMDIEGHEVSA